VRHLLEDTSSIFKDDIFYKIILRQNGSDLLGKRVFEDDTKTGHYLMLTSRMPLDKTPFIFSTRQKDLALISLDDIPVYGKQFIETLDRRGYKAISLNDIDTTSQINNNAGIIAIGFPSFSEIFRSKLADAYSHWQSNTITIPVLTKGIIEDQMKDSFYFTGNIFIYHGFSGGPVIKDNKLIGISKAYEKKYVKTGDPLLNFYFKEVSVFTKCEVMMPLLKELQARFKD
jgi:hypothetical protein